MLEIQQRLIDLRHTLRLNQTNFALKLGLKRPTLAGYEKGSSLPSAYLLLQIRELFNVNVDWLLTGEGEMFLSNHQSPAEVSSGTKMNRLPIYNEAELPAGAFVVPLLDQRLSAGAGAHVPEEDNSTALVHVPASLARYGDKLAALKVDGDSMHPTLHRGDLVVCDSCGWSGEGIYAVRMGGEGFVKRLSKRPGKILIISDNPKYPPQEEPEESQDIEIIGRVHCAIVNVE